MSPIIKSAICAACAVFFVVINTIILFLRPEFTYAKNDDENYHVYYQKWIRTVVFMSTIMIALFSIYFALNLKLVIAYLLLCIECLLLVIYALCKYKCVTVNGDELKVERLFCKELNSSISKIQSVTFYPTAKVTIKISRTKYFDVSCNSENFHKLYNTLLKSDVKFKTAHVPSTENNVYLSKFDIAIRFPKTMFREYYQSKKYFRNSLYLFSARSLENKEYIEGYYKESDKEVDDFIELVKNDLNLNEFKVLKTEKDVLDGYEFNIIKSISKEDKNYGRYAFIYNDKNKYFVMYADYLIANEEEFIKKIKASIHKPLYEDGKSKLVRV